MKDKIINWLVGAKTWLAGFGAIGLALWWIIKILACLLFGVCIL